MAAPPTGGPGPALVAGLVGLLCLIWGSTWLVIRESLVDLPPFTSAAARFVLAWTLMVPVCFALARRETGERPPLWLVLLTGTLNFAVSYGIVYWCEQTLPSALASILWAVFPLLMALASHVAIPGERLGRVQALGFVVGFAGVVLLLATDVRGVGADAVPAAVTLLISPVVVAVATVFIKRRGGGVASLLLNRDALLVGAAELVLLAFVLEDPIAVRWTTTAMLAVAYLAVVGTVLTFSVYFWLLRYAPASKLAVIPYVSPAVALVLGVFVAGEPLTAMAPAGLALILGGVIMATGFGASGR